MNTAEYRGVLRHLGLAPCSKFTAAHLGLSVRQCCNLSTGKSKPNKTLALLLFQYVIHGLPADNEPQQDQDANTDACSDAAQECY